MLDTKKAEGVAAKPYTPLESEDALSRIAHALDYIAGKMHVLDEHLQGLSRVTAGLKRT